MRKAKAKSKLSWSWHTSAEPSSWPSTQARHQLIAPLQHPQLHPDIRVPRMSCCRSCSCKTVALMTTQPIAATQKCGRAPLKLMWQLPMGQTTMGSRP
jgi:hypothetical protein